MCIELFVVLVVEDAAGPSKRPRVVLITINVFETCNLTINEKYLKEEEENKYKPRYPIH